jgi:hypothetical protein
MAPIIVGSGGTGFEGKFDRIGLPVGTSDPSSPSAGEIYFNSSTNKIRQYNGTAWADFTSSTGLSFSVTDKWGFESNSLISTGTSASSITSIGPSFSSTSKTGSVALSFDGSNDYATFPGGASTTIITIAFWIYWRGHNPSGRTYLTDFRATNSNAGYWLLDNNNTMTFSINGNVESTHSFTPNANVWEHYAFVSSSGGSARIYRNGSEIITVASSGATINGNIAIGTFSGVLGGSGNYFMNAIIDNFVFNRGALTSAQISELYTSTSNFS